MAEEIDEIANEAHMICDAITIASEGKTKMALLSALTAMLGILAVDAEDDGIPIDHFLVRVDGGVRKAAAQKREMSRKETLQ